MRSVMSLLLLVVQVSYMKRASVETQNEIVNQVKHNKNHRHLPIYFHTQFRHIRFIFGMAISYVLYCYASVMVLNILCCIIHVPECFVFGCRTPNGTYSTYTSFRIEL